MRDNDIYLRIAVFLLRWRETMETLGQKIFVLRNERRLHIIEKEYECSVNGEKCMQGRNVWYENMDI